MSGTGSAGMEACFVNLLEPGDTAIVGANGVFGERMCEVARRCGAEVVRVEERVGARRSTRSGCSTRSASTRDARLVAVVHAETSTGVENDIAPLAALQDTDTLLLVDTVTSLGGIPVEVDGWGVDAVLLGHPEVPRRAARPLAGHVLAARRRARRRPRAPAAVVVPRPRRCIANYVDGVSRVYHHTAPVAMVFALHAALGAVLDEGLEAAWAATAPSATRLQGALPELGFRLVVPDGHRLPELTTAWLPDGADDADAAQGAARRPTASRSAAGSASSPGKAWRIGLMGHSARERSVTTLLGALRELLWPEASAVGSAGGRSMCSR